MKLHQSVPSLVTWKQEPKDESGYEFVIIIIILIVLLILCLILPRNILNKFISICKTAVTGLRRLFGSTAVTKTDDILKLNIDCFEEVFDYLPIKDLVSVGKTCKWLQQVAAYCYHQNYMGRAYCSGSGINYFNRKINVEHFARFIQELSTDEKGFQNF